MATLYSEGIRACYGVPVIAKGKEHAIPLPARFFAVVAYVVDDTRYEMTGIYTSPPSFEVGQTVRVRYDRRNPDEAQIDNFWDLWGLPLMFVPIPLLVAAVADVAGLAGLVRAMLRR